MTDKNREFAELCGVNPTKVENAIVFPGTMDKWPDFAADPRLVLREMMKREDWWKFILSIWDDYPTIEESTHRFFTNYIIDTTGLLRDKAIEWMKGRGEMIECLKRADAALAEQGWNWDWEQMKLIQKVVERTTGEQMSLEQVDAVLSFLSSQRVLKEAAHD